MKRLKKSLLLIAMLIVGLNASAQDFEVDGIYYNILSETDLTCEVTQSKYSGSITIPETAVNQGKTYKVTSIGDYAFYNCNSLTSVTIGNSVTSIGSYAFNECGGLISITIGSSVTEIGESAFFNCSILKDVYINDLKAWCNINCKGNHSNPLLYHDHNLYLNGEKITDLVIPDGVNEIRYAAFTNCVNLTSVTIPNSVTVIGGDAFRGCRGLATVSIGKNVKTIGTECFTGSGLTSIVIPDNVTSLGGGTFRACKNLTSVTIGDNIKDNIGVIEFGGINFEYCDNLTEVIIGKNVNASLPFSRCPKLTSITIKNNVNSIGDSFFRSLTSLKILIIENSANKIDLGRYDANPNVHYTTPFYDCSSLENVYIGRNIQPELFSSKEQLKSVTISDNVTEIPRNTFSSCSGLTSVTIPNSVTSIGNSAFSSCSGLTSVTIPNSVTTIGGYAFENCSGLTSVNIGNSVTTIGSPAFRGCSSLESIEIGEGITDIGNSNFDKCNSLKYVKISDGEGSVKLGKGSKDVPDPQSPWITHPKPASLFVNSTLEGLYIGKNFNYDSSSQDVLPFYSQYKLKTLVLSDKVTQLGTHAFSNSPNLVEVISKNPVPPVLHKENGAVTVFNNNAYNNATLYIPQGSLNAYKQAEGWKNFFNIQEKVITGVENVEQDINEEVKVFANGGSIVVLGAEETDVVEIFNLNGQLVIRGFGNEFKVAEGGIYIVRIAGKTYKVVM